MFSVSQTNRSIIIQAANTLRKYNMEPFGFGYATVCFARMLSGAVMNWTQAKVGHPRSISKWISKQVHSRCACNSMVLLYIFINCPTPTPNAKTNTRQSGRSQSHRHITYCSRHVSRNPGGRRTKRRVLCSFWFFCIRLHAARIDLHSMLGRLFERVALCATFRVSSPEGVQQHQIAARRLNEWRLQRVYTIGGNRRVREREGQDVTCAHVCCVFYVRVGCVC